MKRNSLARRRQKLNGANGLVAAVVSQATQDALYGEKHDKRDALRYLRSEVYQAHLHALGVPSTWLPEPD